jgi:hypothetical protein
MKAMNKTMTNKNELYKRVRLVEDMLKGITGDEFRLSAICYPINICKLSSKKIDIELRIDKLFMNDTDLFDSLYDAIKNYNESKKEKIEYYS